MNELTKLQTDPAWSLSVSGTVDIPSTIDEVKPMLDMFQLAGGWASAAFVYAFTEVSDNQSHVAHANSSMSAVAFAGLGMRGLKSKDTVRKFHKRWQEAIDAGWAVPVKPGDKSVTLPTQEFKADNTHVSQNSGDNEWYTPPVFIDSAIRVMGAIDLDPASSASANVTVGAAVFYTKDDSGLDKPWAGRVWMNPPYASPLITQFTEKLVTEYVTDNVSEACVLVNNATETGWFINMAKVANAFCFPDSRVKFWKPDGTIAAPLQGQGVLYFGENGDKFVDTFGDVGFCLVKP